MSTITRPTGSPVRRSSNGVERIPALESGDHLTRAEFERRYDAMPQLKKAELIEGVVYVASPVRLKQHAAPHYNVIGWLNLYTIDTPGLIGGDNGSIRLDMDNEPQPDAFLIIDPDLGGQARIDDDGYVAGGPELVVEVSASSASYDLHEKLAVYRRNGVKEYITWRIQDGAIDWRVWRDGEYLLIEPSEDGIYRSEIFPGLALDAHALIDGNMPRVAEVQRAALGSPGYAAFVERLQKAVDPTGSLEAS